MNYDLEAFADIAHNQWCGWMTFLFSVSKKNEDGTVTIPAGFVERWESQIKRSYNELSEIEKQSDRDEALKYINEFMKIII